MAKVDFDTPRVEGVESETGTTLVRSQSIARVMEGDGLRFVSMSIAP